MYRILIADDEPHVIRVMKLSLERAGHRVDVAPNGAVALEKLQTQPHPDILITDIQMPKMTGQQLCQAIAEQWPERHFHIFVATSRAETEHRDWTRGIQQLTFLEKPVSIRQLSTRIDDLAANGHRAQPDIAEDGA